MPHKTYIVDNQFGGALLEVTWRFGYSRVRILLDGVEVAMFPSKQSLLSGGQTVRLPDGSDMSIYLVEGRPFGALQIERNGAVVEDGKFVPKNMLGVAIFLLVFIVSTAAWFAAQDRNGLAAILLSDDHWQLLIGLGFSGLAISALRGSLAALLVGAGILAIGFGVTVTWHDKYDMDSDFRVRWVMVALVLWDVGRQLQEMRMMRKLRKLRYAIGGMAKIVEGYTQLQELIDSAAVNAEASNGGEPEVPLPPFDAEPGRPASVGAPSPSDSGGPPTNVSWTAEVSAKPATPASRRDLFAASVRAEELFAESTGPADTENKLMEEGFDYDIAADACANVVKPGVVTQEAEEAYLEGVANRTWGMSAYREPKVLVGALCIYLSIYLPGLIPELNNVGMPWTGLLVGITLLMFGLRDWDRPRR